MAQYEDDTRKPRRRRKLPIHVKQSVLMEAGYMCGNPVCRRVMTLEIHHIVWVSDDDGDEPTNLLALCPNCHSLHTKGEIPQAAIRHWKGMLAALNHAFDRGAMDLLLFLYTRPERLFLTGDGILKFAGLISSGLVECEYVQSFMLGSTMDTTTSGYRVWLGEAGRLLVEAWQVGDEARYRAILAEPRQLKH